MNLPPGKCELGRQCPSEPSFASEVQGIPIFSFFLGIRRLPLSSLMLLSPLDYVLVRAKSEMPSKPSMPSMPFMLSVLYD